VATLQAAHGISKVVKQEASLSTLRHLPCQLARESNASESTVANAQSGKEYGFTITQHFHHAENPQKYESQMLFSMRQKTYNSRFSL
jgi:hypothetical protein